MYCCIIWHFYSISNTKKIEKMQLKVQRHIYKDYTSLYEMLSEKCNRPVLLIERQRAMLLEIYKCIHELGPRYRHGMFSQNVELMIIGTLIPLFYQASKYMEYFNKILGVYLNCIN